MTVKMIMAGEATDTVQKWGIYFFPDPLFINVGPFPFFIPVIPLIKLVHACWTDTVGKGQMGVGFKIAVHIIPESFVIPNFFTI